MPLVLDHKNFEKILFERLEFWLVFLKQKMNIDVQNNQSEMEFCPRI